MLGNFIYSDDIDKAKYKYEASHKVEKSLKRFLLLAVIFIGGGIIWIFCVSPCMVPAKIDVRSFPGFDKTDVLNFAGITGGTAFIAINAAEAEARLSRHYMVESAKVVKRFPDRLSIFLEPRKAVAVCLAAVNGRTQPVYFDRYGVAVRIGGGGNMPLSLPVVSGVIDAGRQPWLGMKLSASVLPLFSRIGAISDEDPNIWQAISEIGVAEKSSELYDLVLYPVKSFTKLRMGSDINKENIYYALLMYDVCRQMGNAPGEIDIRSGIGVLKAEGAYIGK